MLQNFRSHIEKCDQKKVLLQTRIYIVKHLNIIAHLLSCMDILQGSGLLLRVLVFVFFFKVVIITNDAFSHIFHTVFPVLLQQLLL